MKQFVTNNSKAYWIAIVVLLVAGFVGTDWHPLQVAAILVAVLMAGYYFAAKIQG